MKEISKEKILELENNQEFKQKLSTVKSIEEALKVFAEYGVELTEEEFEEGYNQATKMLEEQGYIKNDELTEKGLDMVPGGANAFVTGVGVGVGTYGLHLLMAGCGPVTWAAGCAIGVLGLCWPRKRR